MKVTINTVLHEQAKGGAIELRHPRWAEFEDWVNLRRANEDLLTPWEPEWGQDHLSRQAYRLRLNTFRKMLNEGTGYPFHIFRVHDDRLMGACNINGVRRHVAQSAQLGYWIGDSYARQGFAQGSVRAAVKFCFETLGLHRVEAAVHPKNTRSSHVLEATGFLREGVARDYLKIYGAWQDHIIYARLSSD